MKKYLAIFLCLLISISLSACNSNLNNASNNESSLNDTSNSGISGDSSDQNTHLENPSTDFEYEISSDGNAVYITKYIGDSDDVVIPSIIEGITVTTLKGDFKEGTISSGVFENSTIKTVVIPNSVTVIGLNSFRNCKNLTEVTISTQCEKLLDGAFQNCENLKSIDLSNSKISLIGISAFENCVTLSEIKLPDSLSKIDARAFYDCSMLLDIHLPQNLVTIEQAAFFNCLSLKMITVPAKLNLMGISSVRFYNMPSLEKIVFEEGRETIEGYAFFDTTTNVKITIPRTVKKFTATPFFAHGPIQFVFLGDCPEIVEKTDFYGEPTIYYDPNTMGWDSCPWKNQYPLLSIT